MEWLAQNWIWVVLVAAFAGMHLFGHGGHGGHGSGSCGGGKPKDKGPEERPSVRARP